MLCAPVFWLLWIWRVRDECSDDPEARSLKVVGVRWPLAPIERGFPAGSIARVEVRGYGKTRRVVRMLHGGREELSV